ncbi:MAG: hypothetical protein AAF456_24140 [Planctomycetota bacterium]
MPESEKRRTKFGLLRFRLRTLIFLLVPAAAVAAICSNEVARSGRERAVIESTLDSIDDAVLESWARSSESPFTVYFDYQLDEDGTLKNNAVPPAPRWLRQLFGENLFAEVKQISVHCIHVSDFSEWTHFHGLERLEIHGRQEDELPTGLGDLAQVKDLKMRWFPGLKNIDELAGLASLETLEIRQCDDLTDLSGIGSLPNLRELTVEQCKSLTTVRELYQLRLTRCELIRCGQLNSINGINGSLLSHLKVANCRNIEDVQAIASMPQLESLHLSCRIDRVVPLQWSSVLPSDLKNVELTGVDFRSLAWLSASEGLQSLSLSLCPSLENLRGLESCIDLDELFLTCEHLESLDGLENCTQISRLDLNCYRLDDTSALANLTSVEHLHCASPIADASHIPASAELTNLEIGLGETTSSLDGFPQCPNLRRLVLNPANSVADISGLQDLNQLEELELVSCDSLESLHGLSGLEELRILQLIDCVSLRSLDGIPVGGNLDRLTLINAKRLDDISALSNLNGLEVLALEGCPAISDCGQFSHLKELRHLDICECPNLESLAGLEELSQLKSLAVISCVNLSDINAINGLKSLENVSHRNCPQIDAGQVETLKNLRPSLNMDTR